MDFKQIQQQVAQKKKRRSIILLTCTTVLALVAVIIFFSLSQNRVTLNELQLNQVESGDLAVNVVANGQFRNRTPSLVTVKQEGVVQEILVEQGQFVEAGAELLVLNNDNLIFRRSQLQTRLNNSQLEYELKNARLALEMVQQEAEVARLFGEYNVQEARYLAQEQLAEQDIVSALDLMATRVNWENLERQHDLAVKTLNSMANLHDKESALARSRITDVESEIEEIERDIRELRLVANNAGQIQRINAQLGENLTLGMPAVELSRSDDLQFVAQVPEREAQRIRNLSIARIRVDGTWLEGVVERVSPNVDNGFVNVFISFEAQPGLLLRQDLSATVQITMDVLEDVLFADRRVANVENAQQEVWVYEPNQQVLVRRIVNFGAISQQKVAIVDGVNPGDLIVSFEQSRHWGNTPPTVIP